MIRHRLMVVLVAVFALLLGTSSTSATTESLRSGPAYTYDNPHLVVAPTHATTERGPQASYDRDTDHDADDRSLDDASARANGAKAWSTTTDTTPALVVQIVRGTGTTQERGQADAGLQPSPAPAGVAAKTADDWPVISGMVRDASKSKGNFGLGSGTASQATRAGESWVGDGYRVASDGKTLISRDGLRAFRPPSWKPNLGKYRANFEHWVEGQVRREPMGNGHFDVTDMP